MTTPAIRRKLHDLIDLWGDKKIRALYTLFAEEIECYAELVAASPGKTISRSEIRKRFKDLETGKVKGVGLDAVQASARKAYKRATSKSLKSDKRK